VFYDGHPFNINDMIQGGDGAFNMFDANEPIIITSTYNNQYLVYNYSTDEYVYINDVESGGFITTFDYDSDNNIINYESGFGTGGKYFTYKGSSN
jgi:hypothetical protein